MRLTMVVLLVTICAPFARGADPTYQGPKSYMRSGPERFTISTWKPGDELFTAVDGMNLRAGPSVKEGKVMELGLGTPVRIVKAATDVVRVGKRVDRWYQVRVPEHAGRPGLEGYAFGGSLTPAGFETDLDGDGKPERVVVVWTPDYAVAVRLVESGGEGDKPGQPGVRSLRIEHDCEKRHCGGTLSAYISSTEKPEIHVVWINFKTRESEAARSVLVSYADDRLRKAYDARLGQTEIGGEASPEYGFTIRSLDRDPRTNRLRLKVYTKRRTDVEILENSVTKTLFTLLDGVYRPQESKVETP